jgi:hypothetical protein
MDPITDVFKTMHVASVVHARLEATAPWGLTREGEAGEQQAPHSASPGYSPSQPWHSTRLCSCSHRRWQSQRLARRSW